MRHRPYVPFDINNACGQQSYFHWIYLFYDTADILIAVVTPLLSAHNLHLYIHPPTFVSLFLFHRLSSRLIADRTQVHLALCPSILWRSE